MNVHLGQEEVKLLRFALEQVLVSPQPLKRLHLIFSVREKQSGISLLRRVLGKLQ